MVKRMLVQGRNEDGSIKTFGTIALSHGKAVSAQDHVPQVAEVLKYQMKGLTTGSAAWFDKLPTALSGSYFWVTPSTEPVHTNREMTEKRAAPMVIDDPEQAEPSVEARAGVDGKPRLGKSFEWCARYVIQHPEAVLVHGLRTVNGDVQKHAWVEFPNGEVVYDGEQGKFFVQYDYKSKMAARTHARYRHADVIAHLKQWKTFGPWEAA